MPYSEATRQALGFMPGEKPQKVTVIVPAAGFRGFINKGEPTWLMTMPSGNLMLVESLLGL